MTASFYHFLADDFSAILNGLELFPNAEVIMDISNVEQHLEKPEWDIFKQILIGFELKKIKYKIVDFKKYNILYINNFYLLDNLYSSASIGDKVFNFFDFLIDDKKVVPSKNVYVSRGKMPWRDDHSLKLSYPNDNRIDSHEEIENLMISMGFEIIYPEDFENFKDQINYFYKVKTIVSLTSSGLANMLFMQPGQTVIEFSTPLVVQSPALGIFFEELKKDGFDKFAVIAQELHIFYKMLAMMKNHNYVSINNLGRTVKEIKESIYRDPYMKNFMDRNE